MERACCSRDDGLHFLLITLETVHSVSNQQDWMLKLEAQRGVPSRPTLLGDAFFLN